MQNSSKRRGEDKKFDKIILSQKTEGIKLSSSSRLNPEDLTNIKPNDRINKLK